MSGLLEIKVLEEHAVEVFRTSLHSVQDLLRDPSVQELMINRADDVWVERAGCMERLDREVTNLGLESAIRALATANNKDVGMVLDCRMPGLRIAAALPPVSIGGSSICIRKHGVSERTLDTYVDEGGFGPVPAALRHDDGGKPADEVVMAGGQGLQGYLKWAVHAKKNILVAGSTSSGKTTFLNALLREVPDDQRVLTIEDTAELKIKTPNYVGLEAMPQNDVTIRSLVRLALRFRPDRIVVGEVRGAEAYDLLDALNTGHSGGACSMHANSPKLALARIESMVRMNESAANLPHQALRDQIASTFDIVVFCARNGHRRGPVQVVEIHGLDETGGYKLKTVFNAN